jgi:trehalose/maltose transport system substrate-binding protein
MRNAAAFLLVIILIAVAFPMNTYAQSGEVRCFTEESADIVVAAGAAGEELDLAKEAAAEFMEYCPNITVRVLEDSALARDRLGFYLQRFEAQSADVDVVQIDVTWPGQLAEHLVNLAPYLTREQIAAHFPVIIQNNTVDGALVAVPWFMDVGLLYYRTDLLEKYGFDAPPDDWDELAVMAQAIQNGERVSGNNDLWGFVFQGGDHEDLVCNALEWQYSASGTQIIDPITGEIEISNDANIAALERAAGWVGTISPVDVTSYDTEDTLNAWQSGNAAFMRNWTHAYSISSADSSAIKGQFGVSPLPSGASGHGAAALGGWQLAVSKYSDNPDAAAAVAVFMTDYDQQKKRALAGSFNPTIRSLYEDQDVREAAPLFDSLPGIFIDAVARPANLASADYSEISAIYFNAVNSILNGEEDAMVALELLELDMSDVVGN